jgi:hypothetical protein
MNKKQKILTLVALVVFILLGAFHYLAVRDVYYVTPNRWVPLLGTSVPRHAIVSDVRMPWFMHAFDISLGSCVSRIRPSRYTEESRDLLV